ncbi:hypothetical protein [Leptolyngbya sp. 7M]|uniref:hypothetical protein n=1 Tax=Leptolyngbya sp. 7M TaxID=2812896 RepID=UPI001B8B10E0|nr:hypothetical protein [Leptolyngbya sp. 7M]QYO68918.1 hypothetical protein JVX88_35730 [Leptolyngbya sp. 7M]
MEGEPEHQGDGKPGDEHGVGEDADGGDALVVDGAIGADFEDDAWLARDVVEGGSGADGVGVVGGEDRSALGLVGSCKREGSTDQARCRSPGKGWYLPLPCQAGCPRDR